jgi:16S rRNA processing protein RimM
MTDYTEIGYTQKTHGVKGELKFFVEDPYWEIVLEKKRVFLDIKGIKVPYFIQEVRGAEGNIVQFEEVPNREAALSLQSRKMFLLSSEIPDDLEIEEEGLEYAYLQGYLLTDEHAGKVGIIEEILDMPQQEMAFLKYNGREILIPLNDQLIVRIDESKREILMDLPDGILEV